MKKILSILCFAVVLTTVSSCTKQYVTPNPNQTVFVSLKTNDWQLSSDGKSYYAPIELPENNEDLNHFGGTIVSIWFPNSNSKEVYEQLPEVFGGISYSYTYNAGNLTLYAQTPDGTAAVPPTDPINVKILLVDSN